MIKKLKIPILDLKREYLFLAKDIDRELKDCFNSQQWILGEKVSQFEKKVAEYLGVKYAVGVASGTDALVLSLSALAVKLRKKEYFDKKDEIITTPFTFISTAEAIIRCGATPVFVDINPHSFNIEPKKIEMAVTKNTVGILPVHLYGNPCEMDEILKVAKENNLFIVEDNAQGFGGIYKGKKLGTIGDCGAFSFFPSKNLGGYGDGGLIATNSARLKELVKVLRNHGQIKRYNASYLGYNSRLDSIQSAILLVKLKYIDRFNGLRREIAEKYNEAFRSIEQIKIPQPLNIECRHTYHLYTIRVTSLRDSLVEFLNSNGIETRFYYPFLLSHMGAFKNCKIKGNLRYAKGICQEIVSLPIHPFLKEKEIDYVISVIKRFFNKSPTKCE